MAKIKVLSQQDVANVTSIQDIIASTESVYCQKCLGQTEVWPTTFYEVVPGRADMDIKSGYLKDAGIFGHKTVSWFGGNSAKGLPELTGAIMVFSAETGMPLGVLDAAYITGMRTGAAGAIGAKYLARKGAKHLLLLGCGGQAIFQIAAMLTTFPDLEQITVSNPRSIVRTQDFVNHLPERLNAEFDLTCSGVKLTAAGSPEEALKTADIVVTVTPSKTPLIKKKWVRPGTHFSCIGADAEGKEELDPAILENARIFVDDKMHCVATGEIEIPIKKGIITPDDVAGEIGELILGKKEGRSSGDEITVYDATGMALLDIAAAKAALEAAERLGLGQTVEL